MPPLNANQRQLKAARAIAAQQKRAASAQSHQPVRNVRPRREIPPPAPIVSAEHWLEMGQHKEDEDESEVEVSDSDTEEMEGGGDLTGTDDQFESAFKLLMSTAIKTEWSKVKFPYQRGPELHRKTIWEHEKRAEKEKKVLEDVKIPKITQFFEVKPGLAPPKLPLPTQLDLTTAISLLEKKLKKKKPLLSGQNLMRHRAVLIFLNFQASLPKTTRLSNAILAAQSFRRGVYLARKIISWERQWRESTDSQIQEGKSGCHVKTRSWFNDEGVQLAAREFIQASGKQFTAYKLAKAISEYLDSKRSHGILEEAFQDAMDDDNAPQLRNRRSRRIKARTARSWLQKMGFKHCRVTKSVFIDGHERDDVIAYRNDVFLPDWLRYRRRMVAFEEDGTYKLPDSCKLFPDGNYYMPDGTRPIVLVTHDESTFNANDGKRSGWFKIGSDGKPQIPIEPKSRGKGIMVSLFLTPGGILRVPDEVSDADLLQDPIHPRSEDGTKPLRQAVRYLEYGKDNYWTGDLMVDQTITEALPIFRRAFPKFQALFAFDNASNHCAFANDALVVDRMNLSDGGKAPRMHETYFYRSDGTIQTQSMYYPEDSTEIPATKRGLQKGMKTVLQERGLWPVNGRNVLQDRFLADCPTSGGRPGCPDGTVPELAHGVGVCCARTMLRNQDDFQKQKGRLEVELTDRSQLIIFYPKFHCELNFIERFWAAAKYYTREHCQYDFAGLRKTIPAALSSVSQAQINRYYRGCERTIDAYADPAKYKYGTKEFQERKYKGHRQVIDRSKW